MFWRISNIINASGSIHGVNVYCTIQGVFYAFSPKREWFNKLHKYVVKEAEARGLKKPVPGTPSQEGNPVDSVPEHAENFMAIVEGEEFEVVTKAELPREPFYVATIFVNDRIVAKVDLVEGRIDRLKAGLRQYFESLLIGVVGQVVKWSYSVLDKFFER